MVLTNLASVRRLEKGGRVSSLHAQFVHSVIDFDSTQNKSILTNMRRSYTRIDPDDLGTGVEYFQWCLLIRVRQNCCGLVDLF
jgi:hypothetical protein